MRVLTIEDERLVALDLQETVRELGYDAYATASSGAQALALAQETPPDIALADVRIEGALDGIETATQLHRQYRTAVIFLTAHGDDVTVERARGAEPSGYLIKPVNASALKAAIEIALDQRRRNSRIAEYLRALDEARSRLIAAAHQETDSVRARFTSLTPRERELLKRLLEGQSNKAIAADMGISTRTVELHRANIMQKTGARSLAHLVRMGMELELPERAFPAP